MKALYVCSFLLFVSSAFAATPSTASLNAPAAGQTSSVSWSGGPYTGATADPAACTTLTCDRFTLTVNVPAPFYSSNPNYIVQVSANWASNTNDFDLYVLDSAGNTVCSSGQSMTTSESADCGQLASGTYTVQVVAFATVNSGYSGKATLSPAPADSSGRARYKSGAFTFSNSKVLPGPNNLLTTNQGIEPRVRTDAMGNIYAAAIQGVPGGTDVWKSMDGGNTFTYLGEPDGAQAAAALGARGAGAGGGDEDLAISTTGYVYVNSLWLGSSTQSTSFNGGSLWTVNPFSSDVPVVDRQWIAANGPKELYLTYKQIGADLNGTQSILVAKSFDGGITFPQITNVTTPVVGLNPGDQGNIEVDPNNGYVYTVFFGADEHTLYISRSTDGGKSFTTKLVYNATSGKSLVNVFPSLAIDNAGNLYIVFSDSHAAYLTTSTDHGVTWSVPVRVSNGTTTKTVIAPWITAGDPGKINVMWWGTPASSNNDLTAQWKVFFAQSLNALDKVPTFAQTTATGVMHQGAICNNGLGCPDGTRNLAEYFAPGLYTDGSQLVVYSDDFNNASPVAVFIRQTGGSRLTK
jgi:hypothetical protein